MTQANLLEQARSGDPSAIAALMNRTLQPKGITATVDRSGDRLIVNLEAAKLPNRQAMTTFVQNGILGLKTQAIREIVIYGRQTGEERALWEQEIYLGLVVDRDVKGAIDPVNRTGAIANDMGKEASHISTGETAPAENAPPPPPMRPVPPPIPRLQPPNPIVTAEVTKAEEAIAPTPAAPVESDPIESEVVVPIEPVAVPEPQPHPHAAIPPGEEIVTAKPARRSRSGWLLPLLVLALLSGLIGAIVGYALWRDVTNPPPSPVPPSAVPPTPVSPATPSPTNQTRANPLQEAIAKQTQAETLARSAQSADDWSLVASQWQQAIVQLQSLPASSADYATAQTRLRQAQTQLASARQQASRPIASAPPPNTTFTVTREIRCPTTATGGTDAEPIELSNVSFQAGNQIVGCITNNTNQPIAAVSIAYQGETPTPAETPTPDATATATPSSPAVPTGSSALSFSDLAPQRTVPFSGSIALDSQVSNITISTVNWTPAGASEPQQLPVSVALAR